MDLKISQKNMERQIKKTDNTNVGKDIELIHNYWECKLIKPLQKTVQQLL